MKKILLTANSLLLAVVLCACSEGTAVSPDDMSSSSSSSTVSSSSVAATASSSAAVGESTVRDDASNVAQDGSIIKDFEIIYQEPELPTGCEITAFAMLLNYYIEDVDKIELARDYLPTTEYYSRYDDKTGKMVGPDLNEYFVGDPFTQLGYVCGTGAIMTAGTDYLKAKNSSIELTDGTGASCEDLYSLVDSGTPVMVWVTIGMEDRMETKGWYIEGGDYVEWSNNDHAAVLIGYDEKEVVIADPIYGEYTCDRAQFESVYNSRGNKCVYVKS